MNAAKYIRYILTIATALLFFSACKVGIYQATQLDKLYHNDQ